MTTQTQARIEPIRTVEREWCVIEGHEHLGEFQGNEYMAQCELIHRQEGHEGEWYGRDPRTIWHCEMRTIQDVLRDLNTYLRVNDLLDMAEGCFSNMSAYTDKGQVAVSDRWPTSDWIAVFVVTGGSEGYYVHIEHVDKQHGTRRLLGLCKFLSSQDDALALANITTKLLGA